MTDSPQFHIRALEVKDRAWVANFMDQRWHSTKIVSRGQVYYGHLLEGFAAFDGPDADAQLLGLATYRMDDNGCELTTLDSITEGQGVATALIEAVRQAAIRAGCKRLWLITTNDNLPALRFYQKRGFHLTMVYPNALDESRRLKPQIPIIGNDGIPLRDELQLELPL